MSAVTTMSAATTRSAIQSSAASNAPVTTCMRTRGARGTCSQALATNVMASPCRSATFTASGFTGQASASMYRWGSVVMGPRSLAARGNARTTLGAAPPPGLYSIANQVVMDTTGAGP